MGEEDIQGWLSQLVDHRVPSWRYYVKYAASFHAISLHNEDQ